MALIEIDSFFKNGHRCNENSDLFVLDHYQYLDSLSRNCYNKSVIVPGRVIVTELLNRPWTFVFSMNKENLDNIII